MKYNLDYMVWAGANEVSEMPFQDFLELYADDDTIKVSSEDDKWTVTRNGKILDKYNDKELAEYGRFEIINDQFFETKYEEWNSEESILVADETDIPKDSYYKDGNIYRVYLKSDIKEKIEEICEEYEIDIEDGEVYLTIKETTLKISVANFFNHFEDIKERIEAILQGK